MKYRLFLPAVILSGILLTACGGTGIQPDSESSIASGHISEEPSDSDIQESQDGLSESPDAESKPSPEERYDFLKSKYVVVSTQESFEKKYICEYYFVDGKVAGMKRLITLPDLDSAKKYYEHTKESRLDAELDGCTVVIYIRDRNAFCYGYSLEKLEFVLEKSGYAFELNFEKEDFYKEFAEESSDK